MFWIVFNVKRRRNMYTVKVKATGGIYFEFKSSADNFIDNVKIAIENLRDHFVFDATPEGMGSDFVVAIGSQIAILPNEPVSA